ncbi:MAG TPA: hypothetical protein VGG39_12665 [Polyangiaceae bacterium]|jgi:hypothetical protein
MTVLPHRTIVVLKLPLSAPALFKVSHVIVTAMTGNAYFPKPTPDLATVTAQITALGNTDAATKTRANGTVQARNDARLALVQSLHMLKAYVQSIADASPEIAETIIASASMGTRKTPVRTKAPFVAKPGATSGTVVLVAKAAARRASYEWEWSSDGGKTWTGLPTTLQAKTSLTGVAPATNALFRYRAVTLNGEGDWSVPVPLLVK